MKQSWQVAAVGGQTKETFNVGSLLGSLMLKSQGLSDPDAKSLSAFDPPSPKGARWAADVPRPVVTGDQCVKF